MKKLVFFLALVIFSLVSCQKKPKTEEVNEHLNKAMREFLYSTVNNDSSKVKFDVQEVLFYEAANFYECEYKVRVVSPGKDTTGIMKARVSKDFTKVNRKD
jgi:hypothetical protein